MSEFTSGPSNPSIPPQSPEEPVFSAALDSPEDGEQPLDPIEEIVQGVDPSSVDEDALEDLVDKHPVAQELSSHLRNMRRSGNLSAQQEEELVSTVRFTREEVGHQIKERLGIAEPDPSIAEREAEAERLRTLGGILMDLTHQESEDELMQKYRLVDENGQMTEASMRSPLFRGDTRRAFDRYMKYVTQYDAMEQAETLTGTSMRNTAIASNLRGEAHNAVARMVERDLGLPFDAARRFVAKARDAVVPGSHEKTNYATLLRGEKLATKFGHDAAAFTKESLKDLIEKPMDHEK